MKKPFFSWLQDHFAKKSDSVLVLCDLGYPEALELQKLYPTRVINVGVAEQSAALVAKGLCSQGFEVFLYGVSSFTLWRSAEVLKIYFGAGDSLRLIGNGGGFGYGVMGSTHHSLDDLGLISLWKSWTSWIPMRDGEIPEVLNQASGLKSPQYIRLTNNATVTSEKFQDIKQSGAGSAVTVVCYGPLWDLVHGALAAVADVQVFAVNKWPVDFSVIQKHFSVSRKIVFFEEHEMEGGLSQKMVAGLEGPRRHIHIQSATKTVINGSRNYLLERQGFSSENIQKLVTQMKNKADDAKSLS
jgi:transketolase